MIQLIIFFTRYRSEIEDNLFENPGLYQRKMYLLGVAYSSNIGGTGTLTGIPTNVAFLELMKPSVKSELPEPISS